ncbi:MAG TPA: cytochrome c oxidase assembly protein [Ktedonobacteraceae bacterium]|nr:cytochrome c oxidase assembly protein [Ktedonobacteraceae bacterium]
MSIWFDVDGWPVPPIVLLGCLVAETLYFRGWFILVKAERAKDTARVMPSGSEDGTIVWDSWLLRGVYFTVAILIALVGDSAPVDFFSGRLFWVHMVQHLLLLVIMAPLLVASAPLIPVWLGLPGWARRAIKAAAKTKVGRTFSRVGFWVGHWLRHPAIAYGLLVVGVWAWHWPSLYDLALTNDIIHDWCEHLTFLVVSILFWTQIIPSPPLYPRLSYMGRIGCVGAAIAQNVILAVLLGFAQVVLYAPYAHLGVVGGFTALQDQQLGAGIMWTFGDVPFMIAFGILMQRWLATQSDADTTKRNDTTVPEHEAASAGP